MSGILCSKERGGFEGVLLMFDGHFGAFIVV